MFDLDAGKLVIFGIVALAVIPPKDLPRVLRTVGNYVGKMRRMASEFQGQFMDAMKEAEKAADLDSVKKEFTALENSAKIDASFDPARQIHTQITNAVDGVGGIGATTVALDASAQMTPLAERFAPEALEKPPEPAPPAPGPAAESPAPSHAQ